MTDTPVLSVVILCYRSEERIIEFAEKTEAVVRHLTPDYEIILVANYFEDAHDRTRSIVMTLAAGNPHFITICKPKEGMMGWDMRTGLVAATGKFVCVIDGDGQFPIESIGRCYEEIATGRYDLVKTYRNIRNDGQWRQFISWIYNLLFRILYPGLHSRDINSKPKIITREAYQKMVLMSDDWFIDAEIMINVRSQKMRFFEFPVEFGVLQDRSSFVRPGAIFEFMINLVSYRFKRLTPKK